ncbi:MAG: site-2 protease family protein [Candidatus Ranarchaeia archaeon]
MIWWVQLLLYLIGIWGTLLVIDRVFHLQRFNIDLSFFTVVFRTRRINSFIRRLGSHKRWFWNAFWMLGSAIGIVIMGYALYFMANSFFDLLFGQPGAQPIVPILPGINVRMSTLPYILVALLISLCAHELSHGIATIAERLPIKSAGIFLFIIFPGAFVEVDEKQINKRSPKSRMRIFTAGIFANLLTALFVIGLIALLPLALAPMYNADTALIITEIEPGAPADGVLVPYSIIYTINDTEIEDYAQFIQFMSMTKPNRTLTISTNIGIFNVTTGALPTNSSRGYLGILTNNLQYTPKPEFAFLSPLPPFIISQTLFWTFLISISLGVINLLPFPLFDGDGFLKALLDQYLPSTKLTIGKKTFTYRILIQFSARALSILFFGGSIVLTFIRFGALPVI